MQARQQTAARDSGQAEAVPQPAAPRSAGGGVVYRAADGWAAERMPGSDAAATAERRPRAQPTPRRGRMAPPQEFHVMAADEPTGSFAAVPAEPGGARRPAPRHLSGEYSLDALGAASQATGEYRLSPAAMTDYAAMTEYSTGVLHAADHGSGIHGTGAFRLPDLGAAPPYGAATGGAAHPGSGQPAAAEYAEYNGPGYAAGAGVLPGADYGTGTFRSPDYNAPADTFVPGYGAAAHTYTGDFATPPYAGSAYGLPDYAENTRSTAMPPAADYGTGVQPAVYETGYPATGHIPAGLPPELYALGGAGFDPTGLNDTGLHAMGLETTGAIHAADYDTAAFDRLPGADRPTGSHRRITAEEAAADALPPGWFQTTAAGPRGSGARSAETAALPEAPLRAKHSAGPEVSGPALGFVDERGPAPRTSAGGRSGAAMAPGEHAGAGRARSRDLSPYAMSGVPPLIGPDSASEFPSFGALDFDEGRRRSRKPLLALMAVAAAGSLAGGLYLAGHKSPSGEADVASVGSSGDRSPAATGDPTGAAAGRMTSPDGRLSVEVPAGWAVIAPGVMGVEPYACGAATCYHGRITVTALPGAQGTPEQVASADGATRSKDAYQTTAQAVVETGTNADAVGKSPAYRVRYAVNPPKAVPGVTEEVVMQEPTGMYAVFGSCDQTAGGPTIGDVDEVADSATAV